MTSCFICATPRSGSTLLCDLLAATGLAGRPASYFRRQSIPRWAERLQVPAGPDFDRAYLAAILREGRGDGTMFGLRLMWESLPELTARLATLYPGATNDRARLEAAFGPITFIRLSRLDKVAQAVSRAKAEQSGLWHLAADGSERERSAPPLEPEYDAALLRRYVDEAIADEESWTHWFETHDIAPIELAYEALSADPATAIRPVLAGLDLDPAIADGITPRTARMADTQSAEWIARFRTSRS